MRKTLATLALATTLTGGAVALNAPAYAAPHAAPVLSQTGGEEAEDGKESDKTGLWGLLGLLGLAGLLKKKEHADHHTGTTR